MSDLIDILRRMRESAVPSKPSGAVGQMLGCESYRITMTGNSLSHLEELAEAQAKRIAELEAHANELAATCQARDETIHKHWCKVMELESEVARLRVDGTLLDNDRVVNAVSWTLCLQDGCDEDSARNLIWQGNPPEPYGEVWQTYEARAREVLKAAIDAAKESA